MKKALTSGVAILFLGIVFGGVFSNISNGLVGIQKNMSQVNSQASILAYE